MFYSESRGLAGKTTQHIYHTSYKIIYVKIVLKKIITSVNMVDTWKLWLQRHIYAKKYSTRIGELHNYILYILPLGQYR